MKAIVFDEHGPIDVLDYREIEEPSLQPGEVRVAVRACSLNYHDVFTARACPESKFHSLASPAVTARAS